MLFVVFQVGAARYALAGTQVAEVLPAIAWTPVPGAAAGVIGLVNYHGEPVPLVDARAVLDADMHRRAIADESATDRLRLHSRILVVRPETGADAIGILVDRVADTMRRDPREFQDAGTVAQGASYLGPVVADAYGLITWIEPAQLVPASVRDAVLRHWSGAA